MIVDLFLVYQFIKRLATPFDKWEAYKQGVIDEKGNILKKGKQRNTRAEQESFGKFDLLVLKLKKLLAKVPGGSSRLASYAAALFLIKEWKHFSEDSLLTESVTEEQIDESINSFYKRYSYYINLAENVNGKIHPDVVKAYKKTQDAEHRDAEYGTTATKRAVTRTANTLSKKINQHHPNLDMQGKIKLRTQLQNMKEEADLQEAPKPRWKKAGPDGEIETTINGVRYKIEKAFDSNIRHRGEYKVMVWDKRSKDWEWETTEYGKANAKAWIENRLKEEPTTSVAGGYVAGLGVGVDGEPGLTPAQMKSYKSKNKKKRKTIRDIIGVANG